MRSIQNVLCWKGFEHDVRSPKTWSWCAEYSECALCGKGIEQGVLRLQNVIIVCRVPRMYAWYVYPKMLSMLRKYWAWCATLTEWEYGVWNPQNVSMVFWALREHIMWQEEYGVRYSENTHTLCPGQYYASTQPLCARLYYARTQPPCTVLRCANTQHPCAARSCASKKNSLYSEMLF